MNALTFLFQNDEFMTILFFLQVGQTSRSHVKKKPMPFSQVNILIHKFNMNVSSHSLDMTVITKVKFIETDGLSLTYKCTYFYMNWVKLAQWF